MGASSQISKENWDGRDGAAVWRQFIAFLRTRKTFTTGQLAKLFQVAPRTVSKWCDSGKLKGYRIPGSNDRRFEREVVRRFLKDNGMPDFGLHDGRTSVLVLTADRGCYDRLAAALDARDWDLVWCPTGVSFGLESATPREGCVLDLAFGNAECRHALDVLCRGGLRAASVAICPDDRPIEDFVGAEYGEVMPSQYTAPMVADSLARQMKRMTYGGTGEGTIRLRQPGFVPGVQAG